MADTVLPDPRAIDPLKPLPYAPDQRYEVTHDALGPWSRGDVLQGADLAGANLRSLLAGGFVTPTDKARSVEGGTR